MREREVHDDEALLSWLLDPEQRPELDPEGQLPEREARRLAELESFLSTCRSVLGNARWVDAASSRRVARRVLERTTREDLRWRGDLSLCGSFLRDRLGASPLLRLMAASLLLHVFVAVPLLAWYALKREARPHIGIDMRPPPAAPFAEVAPEPVREVLPEDFRSAAILREGDPNDRRLSIENSLRWARTELGLGGPRVQGRSLAKDPVERLLAARSAWIERREARSPVQSAPAGLRPVERALLCDYLLDRFVLEGAEAQSVPQDLRAALEALYPSGSEARPSAERLLEACALARAEAYGLLAGPEIERLEGARIELAPLSEARVLLAGGPGPRTVGPLDATWFAVLERAIGSQPQVPGPATRAWLGWR